VIPDHVADLFDPADALVMRSPVDEMQTIATVHDWFLRGAANGGGAEHWKDGRSANEVAKAWCHATGIAAPRGSSRS
jgi:hypothetical protein